MTDEGKRPISGLIWFAWMVAMWGVFFVLLLSDQLGDVWSKVTQLPIWAEIIVWIALFPWMLGTWVWTGAWSLWLRAGLVICFAAGWTLVSIPRKRQKRADRLQAATG